MELKNYQEDIVLSLIEVVLKDYPDIEANESYIHDIAAYTLNRIPPKYIMSERGFTRFASENIIDDENSKTSLIELMMIINIAIKHLTTRRKDERGEKKEVKEAVKKPLYNEFIHNFPQFIGKVLDKKNNKTVSNACITFYLDNEKSDSAESNWPNPYHTNDATNGFYSFWPKSVIDEKEVKEHNIKIEIAHKDYAPLTIKQVIKTTGSFHINNVIDSSEIINLPVSYLELKK